MDPELERERVEENGGVRDWTPAFGLRRIESNSAGVCSPDLWEGGLGPVPLSLREEALGLREEG